MTTRLILLITGCLALAACNTTGDGSVGEKAQTQLSSNYPRGR